jgi:monoamine oxidase
MSMDRRSALQALVGLAATPTLLHSTTRNSIPERTADVVVVGAGFAGLAAARALLAAGIEPLIVEARDRVGGRTCPASIAGMTIDVGGMWLGPTQTALDALAREYGVATYPQYLAGRNTIELDGKFRSSEGEDYLSLLPLHVKLDVAQLVYRLTKLSDSIDTERPWAHAEAQSLDAMTLATWLEQHSYTAGAMSFMTAITRAVFCAEPADLSFLFFLFYMKSGDNFEAVTTSERGAQQRLFVGGVHQLAQRMADQLGNRVLLDAPVNAITQDEAQVTVTTQHHVCRGKAVVIAVPPALAGQIEYTPVLPHRRDTLTQRMPMGSVIKVWVAYQTPFWRARGLNGLYSSDVAAFGPAFDATPPGTARGLIAGFFDAKHAVEWTARSPSERRAEVIRCLAAALGPKAREPLEYVEKDWTRERYSRGCYTGVLGPGALTQFGPALREPIGRLFFAGTESASVWAGYIDGALRSGTRAAAEVIAALKVRATA